jgi:flagellar protein FlbD
MILVTNLNGEQFYLNPGLIETIEMVPDTLITMANGRKYCVLENTQAVADRIEVSRARVLARSGDPAYLLTADVRGLQRETNELEA